MDVQNPSPVEAAFGEFEEEHRIRSVPLSHYSIELGHLYFEDFLAGPQRLAEFFADLAPWARATLDICGRNTPVRTPRISTCFLIDDYFGPSQPPGSVLPALLEAADAAGLRIDYLVREAACAEADGIPLARLVEERIVADPPPRTTGSRPPVTETGWLCNGQRSPAQQPAAAMEVPASWEPPVQNAANRHSVFVDVELWSEESRSRTWSCAFLATVWQLLRLGLIRYRGAMVAEPRPWPGSLPDAWDALPPVMTMNPQAHPFTAYQAISVLPRRFLATEHAVQTILEQISIDPAILDQILDRSGREGLSLPAETARRVQYVFVA